MSIRVDAVTTEVTAEPAPAPRGTEDARQGMEWRERDRLAAARLRLLRDEMRTHARGFDD